MAKRMRLIRMALLDAGIVALSVWLVFSFRFDFHIPQAYLHMVPIAIGIHGAVHAVCFFGYKMYQPLWRYTSMEELLLLVKTSLLTLAGIIVGNAAAHILLPDYRLPLSLYTAVGYVFLGMAGLRLISRFLHDYMPASPPAAPGAGDKGSQSTAHTPALGNLLIVGAGKAGLLVAREIKHSRYKFMRPVAFVDDDPAKQQLRMMGLPIIGNRHLIPEAVKRFDIAYIVIALPAASRTAVTEILEICKTTPARIKLLPSMTDILNGKIAINMIREVSVNDLLSREPVKLPFEEIRGSLERETILVTGAGGSIGGELCRQLAAFGPRELLLLGHGENSIYSIEQELRRQFPSLPMVPIIADIQDSNRIDSVFRKHRPTVVYHAAAHKHVPLMESNPLEAIKNNVLGTRNVAEASDRYGVERFILVSSDKAVNPTSIMGATKRVAEMIVQHINASSSTAFATVRFGNVLGSRGSVIPLFQKQIENGGPVTITHRDMVRYFMTIPEAAQLVIQASVLAQGGEVFVLDMGKPVRIYDLARDLIRLSGLEPDQDIPIVVTGIRPGEKLYEELLTEEEGLTVTKCDRILVSAPPVFPHAEFIQLIGLLEQIGSRYEFAAGSLQIKKLLKQLVPSYLGLAEEEMSPGPADKKLLHPVKVEVHAGT
ncbi:polysaccharide biosynthesis protein [Paenibacillus koleovorans]|uniref:polysaccharide biosynthesis protein n=1 Tax=Paenibacillus koleovorans TaxID=121608 RepID=UPI000FD793D5|nr:nucleoside-diphosphate sugar epimerase/dehydratase [Paenibacillus koleovorans]